jgi:hypothetical protein
VIAGIVVLLLKICIILWCCARCRRRRQSAATFIAVSAPPPEIEKPPPPPGAYVPPIQIYTGPYITSSSSVYPPSPYTPSTGEPYRHPYVQAPQPLHLPPSQPGTVSHPAGGYELQPLRAHAQSEYGPEPHNGSQWNTLGGAVERGPNSPTQVHPHTPATPVASSPAHELMTAPIADVPPAYTLTSATLSRLTGPASGGVAVPALQAPLGHEVRHRDERGAVLEYVSRE